MPANATSPSANSEPNKGSRGLRILVVDDDRDLVLTLGTLLRQDGHIVEEAYRAQDAMRAGSDFDPDVVLIDIALPDGSGYAVAEHIRRHAAPRRPMIIALTGIYKRPPHDRLSQIVGCDHFLTKPFEIDELLQLIAPLTLESGPAPR
jgi:DNA-binding response OmpR family regulator